MSYIESDNDGGREYDAAYILANPIPARCLKCKRTFTDGVPVKHTYFAEGRLQERIQICNDAIRAPALEGCRCFYCGGELAALEKGGPVTVEQVEQRKSLNAPQPMLQLV